MTFRTQGVPMGKRIWMSLLAGVAMVAGVAAPAAGAACKLEPVATIDIELNDYGDVLLPVKVNGKEAWVLLEMSSGSALISRAAAEQLGLRLEEQHDFQMVVGTARVTHKTVVESLLLGNANFARWSFYINPRKEEAVPMFRGKPLLGALSSQFMNVVDVELSLAQKKLNLFKQTTNCKGKQAYWGGEVTTMDLYADQSGLLLFPMEVDGKRVETSLNTGSRISTISEKVSRQYFGFGRDSPGVVRDEQTFVNAMSYREMALTAKTLSMKDVRIYLYDDTSSDCLPATTDRASRAIGFHDCFNVSPVSLGTDLLKRLRIYIAPKERKIYFTRAATPVPDASAGPNSAAARGGPAADGAAGQ
jgi:hypothetical protein